MKRLRAILLWSGSALLLLIALLGCALVLLLGTEWGARRALPLGASLAGYDLQWQRSSGTLWRGLDIGGLELRGAALELELAELSLAWQPGLLRQRLLQIDHLHLSGLQLRLVPSEEELPAPESEPLLAEDLQHMLSTLPVALHVDSLRADDVLVLLQADSEFRLDQLHAAIHLPAGQWRLRLESLALYDATVDGELSLQPDTLDLAAELNWHYAMEPALDGVLELGGNLRELSIDHRLQTPLSAHSRGSVVPGLFADNPLQLALQHSVAQLDLAQFGVEDVALANVELNTSGTLERLVVELATELQAMQFAPATIGLALVYGGEQLDLEALQIDSTEVSATLSGSYAIDNAAGQLEWRLDMLSPGPWLEPVSLEGLAGNGSAVFSHDDAGVDASLQVGPLAGTLNGYPLAIDGTVVLTDSAPDTVDLQVNNGANTLSVSGGLVPQFELAWEVDISAPENFWQGLSGTLQGSGSLAGDASLPMVAGDLRGSALAFEQDGSRYQLDSLQLDAEATGADANAVVLQLNGLQVVQAGAEPDTWLETAILSVRGNPASHQLRLDATGFDSDLHIALAGARPAEDWLGTLAQAEVSSPWGDWQLAEPVALAYGAAGFDLARHCWIMASLNICAAASQAPNTGLDATLALSGLPLAWLNADAGDSARPEGLRSLQQTWNALLPPAWQLQGELSLNASIKGFQEGAWQDMQAELQLADTQLRMQLGELLADAADLEDEPAESNADEVPVPQFLLLSFSDVSALAHSDGSIWQAELGLAVEQLAGDEGGEQQTALFPRSTINARGSMDADENLQGSLQLDFPSLDWLEALLPDVSEPRGRLGGAVELSGTRTEPHFDASLLLAEASFSVPEVGLVVQELQAGLQGRPEQVNLSLSARNEQGSLQLAAQMDNPLEDTRSLNATLQGEDFLVMNNEGARVEVSPDLQLGWSADGLQVNGSFLVPRASIFLDAWIDDIGSGGVGPSRDAVVVVEDPDAHVAATSNALPFSARLVLSLGDEVVMQGLGLDARLSGDLALQQDAGRPLLAYGELLIPEGSYAIYNQQLQTRDGRVIFYGNPLDPVLDLRASRETPNAEVGMELGGNISALQSTLYSSPDLPDNEILALLITGKSFNNMDEGDGNALMSAVTNFGIGRTGGLTSAIGDTLGLDDLSLSGGDSYLDSSLGMGKHLTPDLLMRYEIGLFDRAATLSVIYSLSEQLKLEVRSGLSQSVDISYSIEKD